MRYLILVGLLLLSCKSMDWGDRDEAETTKIVAQSNTAKFKFDEKVINVLDVFKFDLNQFVAENFVPHFKRILKKHFKDKESDHKLLSELPFYKTLLQYFPESVLSRVRYVAVHGFPTMGELMVQAGTDRARLASFGVHIENDVWIFRPSAITLGDLIYIEKKDLHDIPTFFHECVHVLQYDKYGVDGFMRVYIDSVFAGVEYKEIPFEMTAFYLQEKFQNGAIFNAHDFVRQTNF